MAIRRKTAKKLLESERKLEEIKKAESAQMKRKTQAEKEKKEKIEKCHKEFSNYISKFNFVNNNEFILQLKARCREDLFERKKYSQNQTKAIINIVRYLFSIKNPSIKLKQKVWTNESTFDTAVWWLRECFCGYAQNEDVWCYYM